MNDNRADSFLRLIRKSQRGRLKIYLGYAAGVGKTYQMLLEAQRLKKDGIDVVVGLVETHGRSETGALLTGLELIPRRKTIYRGIEIAEMDLDAILARRPSVVLVDELAHTNIPGSKNAKRYQDVDELLAAGIHVISTLNVQHLESLFETVERVIAIRVRERIPDRIVAEADQLVNVDITSEDLRRRLKEGKVYTHERIETAMAHFFKTSNLEQLRELTLRELAAQLDSRRREPLADEPPSSPDQVMVCLSSRGPNSEALLRYASRLAGRLNRNWYAVNVQTSQERPTVIDAATQRILSKTLTLAQELGATVFTYRGEDVVKTVLQFAKEYRVGHIVIGTPGRKRSFWRRLIGESGILERLVTEGQGLTVVVLDTKAIADAPACRKETEKVNPVLRTGTPLADASVLIWNGPLEKDEAMIALIDACNLGSETDKAAVKEALFAREQQGETFVGEEVALPHVRVDGLKYPVVACGIAKAGIPDRPSGHVIKIMFLLLSPSDPPESHVLMLGAVSRIARDDPWRKEALLAQTADDVTAMLRRHVERLNTQGR